MGRISKNIFKISKVLILSICLILSALIVTGCTKESDLNPNPIKTGEEWNQAVENSYHSLTAPKSNYILETSFGETKTYIVSGDKCEIRRKGEDNFYHRTEDKFYAFYYEKGKGYLRKETEESFSSIGEFVLEDVLSTSSLEDFNSLKDCYQYFSCNDAGVYTLNGNSEVLFAQKVFGEEAGAKIANLDVSVSFEKGLIDRIVFQSGSGENLVNRRITIRWSYRTVTLPTFQEAEA